MTSISALRPTKSAHGRLHCLVLRPLQNLSITMISGSASSEHLNSRRFNVGSSSVAPRIDMWVSLDEGKCCSHVTASAGIGLLSEYSPKFLTPKPLASRSPAAFGLDVDGWTGTLPQARLRIVVAGRSSFLNACRGTHATYYAHLLHSISSDTMMRQSTFWSSR